VIDRLESQLVNQDRVNRNRRGRQPQSQQRQPQRAPRKQGALTIALER